jgi:hypothetical protein
MTPSLYCRPICKSSGAGGTVSDDTFSPVSTKNGYRSVPREHTPVPEAENAAYAAWMAMRFGLACSAFGTVTVSTPLTYLASILSASTETGKVKAR